MRQLATLFLAIAIMAPAPSPASPVEISRPAEPDGGPTEVRIEAILVDVDEIDSVAQSFVANFYLEAQWRDARLAHHGTAKVVRPLNAVWHPQLQFVNQQKIWLTFPEVVEVAPDGGVTHRQRVWGPFSQPLLLHDFPFDRQTFEIRLIAAGHTPQEVKFVVNPNKRSGLAPKFSQPDWDIGQWKLDFSPYDPLGGAMTDASFAFIFEAKRHTGYFIFKIIIPLALIVAMSWVVFWIDPTDSGTQIGVSTTAILALVAYRFVVGGLVPNVSYLTRMDHFIFGSTLLVFASLVQAVVTTLLARTGRIHSARRIDLWCRGLFPALFVAVTVGAFVF